MKASLKTVMVLVMFGLMVFSVLPALAQCSTCAAQVATNSKNGGTTANGLNAGILFLLTCPYLAVGAVGFVWYRKFRKKNVTLDFKNEKLHLN